MRIGLGCVVVTAQLTMAAGAQEKTVVTVEKPAVAPVAAPMERRPAAQDSVTEGSVTVYGKKIEYKAVAGTLTVGSSDSQDATLGLDGRVLADAGVESPAKVEDQPATARIFYTAYFAKDDASTNRPIMFIYNGGPGSATMYLRMASFGPVKVAIKDLEHPVGGPFSVGPNPYSLIDATDLVFIDAPGTGYSRVMGKDAFAKFYGVDQDAAAFDRFIRRFLSKYDKWLNPKFLFGESYGTTRDAVLCYQLQRHGVDLNGVVFLSQILSFNNSADGPDGNPGTDNGYFLAFPSMAATAWFHHKVPGAPASLEAFLHEVEQFSLGEYASALLQGADLDPARKQAVAAKLEGYSGIPAATWMKADLRLTGSQYSRLLQDSTGITTGRLDSRYEGPSLSALSYDTGYDPFTTSVDAGIQAAMNAYAHDTLKYGTDLTYKPSAREPGFNWDMKHQGPGGWPGTYTNVMRDLAATMTINPKMKVLLMGGYYDLGTLYFGSVYEMKHLPMDAKLEKNISFKFFPTGHMVYVNEESLKGLHDRTAQFIKDAK